MKAYLLIIVILLSSCASHNEYGNKLKHPNVTHRVKSEDKQRKFVKVWLVAGTVIIAWAITDTVESERQSKTRK